MEMKKEMKKEMSKEAVDAKKEAVDAKKEAVDAKKEAKAASAKKFAEKQKEAKANLVKFAKEVCALAEKEPNKLSKEAVAFFKAAANPNVRQMSGGQSFLSKVFIEPKVGAKVTLLQYMERTLSAKSKLDKAVKDWAAKGIIVKYVEKPNKLESEYVIEKM